MRIVNCVPIVQTGSVTVMARDIGEALRLHGADVRDMGYTPGTMAPKNLPDLMKWLAGSDQTGLLVDINGAIVTSRLVRPFWKAHGGSINSFTFLTDAPLHFPSRFENWPAGGLVGLVDGSFWDLARFMKYQKPDFISFRHAGPEPHSRIAEDTDRDIDVLVVGNITATRPIGDHAMDLYPDRSALIALLANSFEEHDPTRTPFQTVLATALSMKKGYRRKDVALAAADLERYLNARARAKTVSLLGGLNVRLVGNIAEGAIAVGSHIQALGFLPFRSCVDLMARTKVVVNVRPGLPSGAHERVFYALSRGGAVVTTPTTFLDSDRDAHDFIDFFDIETGNVREKTLSLLEKIDQGALDRSSLRRHYQAHHTWRQRLMPVLTRARAQIA